jgi:hypothetical protein
MTCWLRNIPTSSWPWSAPIFQLSGFRHRKDTTRIAGNLLHLLHRLESAIPQCSPGMVGIRKLRHGMLSEPHGRYGPNVVSVVTIEPGVKRPTVIESSLSGSAVCGRCRQWRPPGVHLSNGRCDVAAPAELSLKVYRALRLYSKRRKRGAVWQRPPAVIPALRLSRKEVRQTGG